MPLFITTLHKIYGREYNHYTSRKSAAAGDDADLQEVYDTERQLLYVACTRARDDLLVTSAAPASEFLDDLLASR